MTASLSFRQLPLGAEHAQEALSKMSHALLGRELANEKLRTKAQSSLHGVTAIASDGTIHNKNKEGR